MTRITRRTIVGSILGFALVNQIVDEATAEDWIVDAIYAAAARYGVSGDWLVATGRCESNLDPSAIGPNGEIGVFQFWPGGVFYQFGGADIYSTWEQADVAARMFSLGYADHWVCSGAWDGTPS